jgi:hypothetical protein
MRESPVPHAPRREATRSYAARLTTPLTYRVALDLGLTDPNRAVSWSI